MPPSLFRNAQRLRGNRITERLWRSRFGSGRQLDPDLDVCLREDDSLFGYLQLFAGENKVLPRLHDGTDCKRPGSVCYASPPLDTVQITDLYCRIRHRLALRAHDGPVDQLGDGASATLGK